MKWSFLLAAACGGLAAAPYVAYRGVVNAASYAPSGLPHGAIARGSVFTIFGRELGPVAGQQVSAFPLAASFGGVSIAVTQGTTTVAAIPLYVSAGQINAILPSAAPLGRVALRVNYNGETSNAAYFEVSSVSLGLYSVYAGSGPGIFQNFVSAGEQPINTLLTTARPGQVVTLWGTGLGAVASDTTAPVAGDLPAVVEIYVGSRLARKLYSGRSPCCAGSDQIVLEIPADAALGCYVPVTVRANGVSSNTVTIALEGEGKACADPLHPLGSASATANERRNAGMFLFSLARGPARLHASSFAHFEEQTGVLRFHPLQALPPAGSCTAYAGKANLGWRDFLPSLPATGTPLSAAASLMIEGLEIFKSAVSAPFYFWQSSASITGRSVSVRDGTSTVRANAGAAVGAFQATVNRVPFPPAAGLQALATVRRQAPLEVRWTPQPNAAPFVIVAGGALNRASNSSAIFLCVGEASAGRLTVPAHILATLPAAKNDARGAALVAVGNVATPGDLAAPGLFKAITLFAAFDYRPVEVQ